MSSIPFTALSSYCEQGTISVDVFVFTNAYSHSSLKLRARAGWMQWRLHTQVCLVSVAIIATDVSQLSTSVSADLSKLNASFTHQSVMFRNFGTCIFFFN